MLDFFKGSKPYQIVLWTILIIATILTIYTPDFFYLRFWSGYTVQIMFSLLLLGLLFLMLRDPKSMYVSFICCGLLCYSLRSREPFYAPREADTMLTVAHIKLNPEDPEGVIKTIMKHKPDIITFQGFNFDWQYIFDGDSIFKTTYQHDTSLFDMTTHSPTVYSKYPLLDINIFRYEDAPNIVGKIEKEGQLFHFINLSTTPTINIDAYKKIGKHLLMVADTVKALNAPTVILGDYNVIHHCPEISNFKKRSNVADSRRDTDPFHRMPYDHIFYSRGLVCVGFSTLSSGDSEARLGILGKYQINRRYEKNVTSTVQ